jgi:uncharacterized protein
VPHEEAVPMKYLLLLVVVGVLVWMLTARRRAPPKDGRTQPKPGRKTETPPAMLACAHCGVLMPPDEALNDAAGRAFCSEAHRLAGPR